MSYAGKRVLVTGGAGFVGSAIVRRLVGMGANVTVVDSLLPQYGGNLYNLRDVSGLIKLNISDVRDSYSMETLLQDVDLLFNVAGQTSHIDSMNDPFTDLDINSRAQLSIVEALRRSNRGVKVVFASTRQVYGRPEYLPVDEAHPIRPVDVNGINKLSGEWFHRLYGEVYGIWTCVLRLTNTYGPGMRIKDARQTFIGVWLRRLLEGVPFEVWGGEQLRDFNYIDDVVDAFLASASNDSANGRVFNLGSREVVSLRSVAELLVALKDGGRFDIKEFPSERRKIDIGDYYSEYGAINSAVGWEPKVSLRDGLQRTIDYFREHLEHYL
jgi:nucleoside-diphosphate-sugar epimerase